MVKHDKRKIKLIFNWCISEFGKSRYNKIFPRLVMYKGRASHYGSYYLDRISVWPEMHKSYLDLCNTIIHEYKHYLLPNESYSKFYYRLKAKGLDVDDISEQHPHEKRCRAFAEKYEHWCLVNLKNELKKQTK